MSTYRFANELELSLSMMERLLESNKCYAKTYGPMCNEFDPRFVTYLKKNYRSLPSVLALYNNLYYESGLEGVIGSDNSHESETRNFLNSFLWKGTSDTCGVFFINVVNGRNCQVPKSPSWWNEQECNAVLSFLSKLNDAGIQFRDIGVVSSL